MGINAETVIPASLTKMSRKYLAIADSQGTYCDICRGRGYRETATCCVKYETDMIDPPNHIRFGSWCTACATDAIAHLGGTDKDHRHQILREKPKYVIKMDHDGSSYYEPAYYWADVDRITCDRSKV